MQDVFVFRRNAQRNRQLAQTLVLDDHSAALNRSLQLLHTPTAQIKTNKEIDHID